MLYILTYTYANVLNFILFYSILTNILCMFYVPFSIAMIAQSEDKHIIIIIHACIIYACILYLVSCILYLVSCILYLVSCILYLVSCILYLVSCRQ